MNTDTISVPAVVTSAKEMLPAERIAAPVSAFKIGDIEREGLTRPKALTAWAPNFYIPDYGSSMTSTLYHRGFGSRIDNPVLGLYVDDIPVLDKNAYDFDFLDVDNIYLFRGAQGTLYGRNAMSGVLSVHSLSPSAFKGYRGQFEWGSGRSLSGKFSAYWRNQALCFGFRHSGGFFDNVYTGKKCDPYDGISLRHKVEKPLKGNLHFENIFSASLLKEGGFAYGQYRDGEFLPVSYNDESAYRRLYLTEGAKIRHSGEKWTLHAIGSIQMIVDRMNLDQDFTSESVFTLEQRQSMAGSTLELILRPAVHPEWWNATTGLFIFGKRNRMKAPVHFLENGIQTLILDNANRHIPDGFGHLELAEDHFPIFSDFTIGTWNTAVYHESQFSAGPWLLTLGLRLDYEGGRMRYDSRATVHYQFLPSMTAPKAFSTSIEGRTGHGYFEILPKLSVLYSLSGGVKLFAGFAKGHKAGGFNTQLFSDILQNRMMTGLMDDLGVHLDSENAAAGSESTKYKPENARTWEAGVKFSLKQGLSGAVSLFYIDCRDQQLTVFPPGQSTGRMMTNAGRSESCGAEAELSYEQGGLVLRGAYGWNRARFVEYADGNADYAGNALPYAPSQTLSAAASYRFTCKGGRMKALEIGAAGQGIGKIWWNEANTLSQPFYFTLGGHIRCDFGKFTVSVRGENLTDKKYRTFYFKSVGNEFFQQAKPRRIMAGISFALN